MAARRLKIVLARTAGFCMGVRRAVKMALEAADDPSFPGPIRTHGPLIHNRQVLQVLQSRGVTELQPEEGDEGIDGGTVVVRAHGLAAERQQVLRHASCHLLDATCPHVGRLQDLAREYSSQGYMVVVVGDAGHAEVEGALSLAGDLGHAVSGPAGVADLPDAKLVAVMAQTTQDIEVFEATARAVRERYGACEMFDTICRSTSRRQAEVREMAARVDAMVVVGGYHSANTRRLAEISAACGTPTFHVETDEQLDVDAILAHECIGLTAGASTPSWMIRKVAQRLRSEHQRRASLIGYAVTMSMRILVNTNAWAAGAAAMLTLANTQLIGLTHDIGACVAVAFFFVMSQHLFNQYGRRASLYLTEPGKADLFMNHGPAMLATGISASALALLTSLMLSWQALALVALGTLAGLMYRTRLPRDIGRRIGIQSLEQVRGSKELFVGLAWASLGGLVPGLAGGEGLDRWPASLVAFAVTFLLAFQRTLVLDYQAVRADQIVGRETLAGVLSDRLVRRVFFAATMGAVLILGIGLTGGLVGSFGWPLAAAVALAGLVFLRVAQRRDLTDEWAEARVDWVFYVAGLCGLVALAL